MVAGDERARRPRRPSAANAGGEVADQQVAGRLAAHVQLVAHVAGPARRARSTSIGPVALEQRAPGRAERRRGRSAGARPPRRRRRRTTASARALVRASRTRARPRLVLDDPHRHRRRADAGHRADVAVLVARAPARSRPPRAARAARVAVARPALEQARRGERAAAAGRTRRSHAIGGPECRSMPSREPGNDVARRRDRRRARGAAPSIARDAPRVGRRDALAVAAPQRLERAHGVRVAAGRRAPVDLDDVGAPWSRSASANAGQPDVHGLHARASTSVASSRRIRGLRGRRWPTWTPSPQRSATRRACAASATSRSSSGSAPASTATTPRSIPHGDGFLRRSAARRCRRRSSPPTRSRAGAAAVVDERLRRARDGRPPARRSSTCSSARTTPTPSASSTGSRGRPACSACRSSAGT